MVYVYGSNFGSDMKKINAVYYTGSDNVNFDVKDNCTLYQMHSILKCYTIPGAGG